MQFQLTNSQLSKRRFIVFLALIILWNATKLPFLMAFNNDGNEFYNSHRGIELSINLGHCKGYRSLRTPTPPLNCIVLVHADMSLKL